MNQGTRHIIMECSDPACRMRFPVIAPSGTATACPICGSPAQPGSGEYEELQVRSAVKSPCSPRIEALLDNIRSLYNVGSMFRTSDGAGISHIHLCGMTPTPDNPKLKKTALGAQDAVGWSYQRNGLIAATGLKRSGMRLWAMEGGRASSPIQETLRDIQGGPIVLVVGNEVSGVDPAILAICDHVFHIPMRGTKTSLNAAVAFGIAAYMLCAAGR